jgi:DtxR family Mn-dependent transcriptional regulator
MSEELTERMEDYLRIIYEIENEKGYARLKDVASRLNVRPPTAEEMLRKLNDMNLIVHEKYGGIRLTKKGREIAEAIEKRFQYVRRFLQILLVPNDVAARDAHIIEHRLHPKTLLQIIRFVEFISSHPEHPKFITYWFEKFKRYCEEKERAT